MFCPLHVPEGPPFSRNRRGDFRMAAGPPTATETHSAYVNPCPDKPTNPASHEFSGKTRPYKEPRLEYPNSNVPVLGNLGGKERFDRSRKERFERSKGKRCPKRRKSSMYPELGGSLEPQLVRPVFFSEHRFPAFLERGTKLKKKSSVGSERDFPR